jgi:hypothetical protein
LIGKYLKWIALPPTQRVLELSVIMKNSTETSYSRQVQLEKRAKLMHQWLTYVESPKNAGAVVPISMEAE